MTKIVILGAGHVGSHAARALLRDEMDYEVVLVDSAPGKAEAQAMDIGDAMTWTASPGRVRAGCYEDCADADFTVVAVGKAREPGQTRLDLLGDSVRMVRELCRTLSRTGVDGVVIGITNPCDIVADCLRKQLGLDGKRVFGTGTLLDTARLIRVLGEQTGYPRDRIDALVMGEHGDSSMIPFSAVRIAGEAPEKAAGFDPADALRRTHGIGMDIINGKGSTEFGIGQSTARLIRELTLDTKAVLPLSALLDGEYGLRGIHCGVPCVTGKNGIESIVELPLTDDEKAALRSSAGVIEKHIRMADESISSM